MSSYPQPWALRFHGPLGNDSATRPISPREEMSAMTTTLDLPDLDGFVEHYGVRASFIGDDGEIAVILGHVEPRRALAALSRCTRIDLGWHLADEIRYSAREMLDGFAHRWAFLMTHCEDYPNCGHKVPYRGEEICTRCKEIHDAGWWMNYADTNTADTPGAFPITFFEM